MNIVSKPEPYKSARTDVEKVPPKKPAKKRGRPCVYGSEPLGSAIAICLPRSLETAVLLEMALNGNARATEIRALIADGLALRAARRSQQVSAPPTEAQPWTRRHFAAAVAASTAKRGS